MPVHRIHFMHDFFVKKEMNLIYLSFFIITFAESMIGIFIPVYLYKLNYPITEIILFYLLISLFFVAFSILGAKTVSKVGVKHAILFSTPFLILFYVLMNYIQYSRLLFFLLPLLISLNMICFNYGFHLNFILHSNQKKRGKELSTLGILSIFSTALGPLFAGLIIAFFGFTALFVAGAIILVAGVLPLFLTDEHYEKTGIDPKKTINYITDRRNWHKFFSFTGYAIEEIISRILWPIFLIILLLTTEKVGFIVTLTFIISIFVYYIIGKFTDKYDRGNLLKIGSILYFFGWLGRIFATSALKVVIVDSYKNLSQKVLHVPWSAKSYDIAARENYYMFIVAREIIFNLARVIVLPFIIMIFYIGFYPFITSFLVAALFTLLYPMLNKTK